MNKNKDCAQEIRQVKVAQLALPQTGISPNWASLQAQIPQLPVQKLLIFWIFLSFNNYWFNFSNLFSIYVQIFPLK